MIPITGKAHDLGDGFFVTRLLPQIARRSIGPFVFFDYFGPVDFAPGKGIDVRPHPHIGLATVTYLFDGSQMHRDTLGTVQEIRPGDVNWMTAGRGIAHSERTGDAVRAGSDREHVEAMLAAHGVKLAQGMMYVRLVHLLDAQKRRELMIIYGEPLPDQNVPSAELMPGGSHAGEWPALSDALAARALSAIRISQ